MPLMPWTPLFSVGIREIDEQHKILFDLANEFDAAARAGHEAEVIERILDDLISYTEYHFASEERLMRRHEYTASAAHLAEHEDLKRSVRDFRRRVGEGGARLTPELLTFFRDWLTRHIMNSDRQLGLALNRKGIH